MAALDARIQAGPGQPARLRAALATWRRQGTQVVSAARLRFRRPALTIGGLGCIDASAFHVSTGLGWLITGISVLFYDHLGGEE